MGHVRLPASSISNPGIPCTIDNYITCSLHHRSDQLLFPFYVLCIPMIYRARLYWLINCLNGREWLWPGGHGSTGYFHSRSSNPRLLWKTINQLLHRNSSSPLPNSLPPSSIAESFCSFFSGKITTLRLSLQSLSSKTTINSPPAIPSTTDDSPPSPPPASLSTFQPTSETEVFNLLQYLPNKQCELDPIHTSLLKDCASILIPIMKKIVNRSLSTGSFPLLFKRSLVTPLLKKPPLDKEILSNSRRVY